MILLGWLRPLPSVQSTHFSALRLPIPPKYSLWWNLGACLKLKQTHDVHSALLLMCVLLHELKYRKYVVVPLSVRLEYVLGFKITRALFRVGHGNPVLRNWKQQRLIQDLQDVNYRVIISLSTLNQINPNKIINKMPYKEDIWITKYWDSYSKPLTGCPN